MRDMIGRGGFACVYRAQCNRTGQEVAIKMVSVSHQHCPAQQPDQNQQFSAL